MSAARPRPPPAGNFRYGARTPNAGIDAEAKWSRPDYVAPPDAAPHPEKS